MRDGINAEDAITVGGLRRPTVLIVDDQPANVHALARIPGSDVSTRFALDGQQALDRMASEPVDLILLDVMMHGLDGLGVCKRLKADPRTAANPVIFVSGLTGGTDEERGFEVSGVDYIHKPLPVFRRGAGVPDGLTGDGERLAGILARLVDAVLPHVAPGRPLLVVIEAARAADGAAGELADQPRLLARSDWRMPRQSTATTVASRVPQRSVWSSRPARPSRRVRMRCGSATAMDRCSASRCRLLPHPRVMRLQTRCAAIASSGSTNSAAAGTSSPSCSREPVAKSTRHPLALPRAARSGAQSHRAQDPMACCWSMTGFRISIGCPS